MEKIFFIFFLLFSLFTLTLSLSLHTNQVSNARPTSQITVMGTVYCDTCSNNTFSRHSYFLPDNTSPFTFPSYDLFASTFMLYAYIGTITTHNSIITVGAEVRIDCKFKATAPKTAEEITFSVNRTTNKGGWYKLEIPAVDGIECAREQAVVSLCRASLVGTSSSKCNVPGYKTTSDVVYFKSSEANICIYGLSALSFRPSRRSNVLCGV